jgi:hypothetical protein
MEYFNTHKTAILLRGFHYKENNATGSTFTRYSGFKYIVDFERVFLESFQRAILDKISDPDIFISTYPSKKQELLVSQLQPTDVMFIGEDDRFQHDTQTQITNMLSGLDILKSYANHNKVTYDFVIIFRMDICIAENILEVLQLDYDKFNYIKEGLKNHLANDCLHMFPYKLIDRVYDEVKTLEKNFHFLPNKVGKQHLNFISEPSDQIYDLIKIDREFFSASRNRENESRLNRYIIEKYGSWQRFKESGDELPPTYHIE